jgi:hypothetical protein
VLSAVSLLPSFMLISKLNVRPFVTVSVGPFDLSPESRRMSLSLRFFASVYSIAVFGFALISTCLRDCFPVISGVRLAGNRFGFLSIRTYLFVIQFLEGLKACLTIRLTCCQSTKSKRPGLGWRRLAERHCCVDWVCCHR